MNDGYRGARFLCSVTREKILFSCGLLTLVIIPTYGSFGTPLTGPELIGTVSVNFGGDARPSVSGGTGLLRKKTHFQ